MDQINQIITNLNLTKEDLIGLQISAFAFVPFLLGHLLFGKLAFLFANVVLASCGGLTMGFSLNSHSTWEEKIADIMFGVVCMLLALSSLHHNSRKPLIVGYIMHGIWDLLHHDHLSGNLQTTFNIQTSTPLWYPIFCFTYDFGVALLYMLSSYPGGSTTSNAQKKKTK